MSRYSPPRPLSAKDDLTAFNSTRSALDNWLRKFAYANHAGGATKTFITLNEGHVVGFYSLAAASVSGADVGDRVGKAVPDPLPVILLARLAVDAKHQGHGLGAHLLRDALSRSLTAADSVGIRAVLVHAKDSAAAAFYQHFGFEPSPTDELHLLLLLKDARAAIQGH